MAAKHEPILLARSNVSYFKWHVQQFMDWDAVRRDATTNWCN